MDSNYILTPSGTFINVDELYHSGIKGMKWGVRRYQNPDGSLTAAGRKRYTNSDGTLNEKGKKYYAKETERLKAEKKALNTQKRTAAKLSKLDEMRKENEDLKKRLNSKKDDGSDAAEPAKPKQKSTSDMDDKELQDRVNRLRNEDAYRDLSKKLGYDGPRTELDYRIAEMEKQKRYLELQRDIKNLTPQKVSKGKQIMDTLMKKVVEPAATEAGKKLLSQYLTEAGAQVLGKTAKKEGEKIKQTVDKSAERVKQKEAKKQAKQAGKEKAKAERQAGKQDSKQSQEDESKTKAAKGTVEGVGNSSRKTSENSSRSSNGSRVTYDLHMGSDGYYQYADTPVTSLTTSRNTSAGRSWVSGYLSAPKDDDD